jgi:hypothetical protein
VCARGGGSFFHRGARAVATRGGAVEYHELFCGGPCLRSFYQRTSPAWSVSLRPRWCDGVTARAVSMGANGRTGTFAGVGEDEGRWWGEGRKTTDGGWRERRADVRARRAGRAKQRAGPGFEPASSVVCRSGFRDSGLDRLDPRGSLLSCDACVGRTARTREILGGSQPLSLLCAPHDPAAAPTMIFPLRDCCDVVIRFGCWPELGEADAATTSRHGCQSKGRTEDRGRDSTHLGMGLGGG